MASRMRLGSVEPAALIAVARAIVAVKERAVVSVIDAPQRCVNICATFSSAASPVGQPPKEREMMPPRRVQAAAALARASPRHELGVGVAGAIDEHRRRPVAARRIVWTTRAGSSR